VAYITLFIQEVKHLFLTFFPNYFDHPSIIPLFFKALIALWNFQTQPFGRFVVTTERIIGS
ncbi:hypothetical protein V5046_16115, partial [Moellerella wisconsensis]